MFYKGVLPIWELTSRMSLVVANATKSLAWEGSDGIITEGSSTSSDNDGIGFKGMRLVAV